jgi:hypothetical protein
MLDGVSGLQQAWETRRWSPLSLVLIEGDHQTSDETDGVSHAVQLTVLFEAGPEPFKQSMSFHISLETVQLVETSVVASVELGLLLYAAGVAKIHAAFD